MQLTYYGHACFAVDIDGARLLFDPFISPNPLAAGIDVEAIAADYVLVSHGHGDHVADVAAITKRTGATLLSNYEIVQWFAGQGVTKGHGMNFGGSVRLPFGRVKFVTAVHSSTLPDGTPGGNPGGFVVTGGGTTFYYAGDTALTYDMKLIAEACAVDVAVLPIGDTFTMDAADAARAAEFVGTKTVVGVHYDTFPPIAIDHDAARAAFAARGITLLLPAIGETVAL